MTRTLPLNRPCCTSWHVVVPVEWCVQWWPARRILEAGQERGEWQCVLIGSTRPQRDGVRLVRWSYGGRCRLKNGSFNVDHRRL